MALSTSALVGVGLFRSKQHKETPFQVYRTRTVFHASGPSSSSKNQKENDMNKDRIYRIIIPQYTNAIWLVLDNHVSGQ